jgi:PAS domain S-box-containing protein
VFTIGVKHTCELWLKVMNHRRLCVMMESIAVEYSNNTPIQCHSAIMDITERKQIEEKLHRYELLADRHRDVILFIALDDGRILEANDAATRVYGYSYKQLLTLTIHDIRAADARGMTEEEITIASGQDLIFEIVHRRKDGSTFPVEVSAQGAEIGGRRILISVIRDITERKRIEGELSEKTTALEDRTRQMEAANKELDTFSYSIAHDLRAPLRAIDGYSRMILKHQGDKFDASTKRQFDLVRNNVKKMGQLIDDILALSRMGRQALSMSRLNMDNLTRDVWAELKALNPDKGIDLKINYLPSVVGDRSLIKQVLVNILSNAIKFTRVRDVPLIEVGSYIADAENVFYIRDNGVGFDIQYSDKLFGVFQRLHSADDYEGTGIGLSIVQHIMHRHNGRVWAESKVDEGSTFFFTFPRKVAN